MYLALGLFLIIAAALDFIFSGFSGIHVVLISVGVLISLFDFITIVINKLLSGKKFLKLISAFGRLIVLSLLVIFCFNAPNMVKSKENTIAVQTKEAFDLADKKDYLKANDIIKNLYDKNPTNMNVKYSYGLLMFNQKRFDEALKLFNEVIAADAYNYDALLGRIKFYVEKKDVNTVKTETKRVIAIFPHRAETYSILGDSYWNEGDLTRAIHYYALSVREAPDKAEYHFILANAYSKSHTYGDALYEYRLARDLSASEEEKQKITASIKLLTKEIDNSELKNKTEAKTNGGASGEK